MRHKMLSVSYNWDNETPKITYHSKFDSYDHVQKVDGLIDVINELQNKREEIQKAESERWQKNHELLGV
jgi:hypothetical protein